MNFAEKEIKMYIYFSTNYQKNTCDNTDTIKLSTISTPTTGFCRIFMHLF